MAKTRATLKDIAERAGVSRYTVARVLNGETKGKWAVSAERIQTIHRLAEEMGYRANTAARAVVTGRFNAAALLMPAEGGDYLPMCVLRALVAQLAKHDMHLSIERIPACELEDAERLPKMLRELSVDGFFLSHATDFPNGLRALIERGGQPAVWLNVKHRHDCVHPADRLAGKELVKRMVDQGHHRIAYLAPTYGPPVVVEVNKHESRLQGWQDVSNHESHYSEEARLAGYMSGCKACGIEPLIWEEGPDARHMRDAYAQRLLDDQPDGVIAYSSRQGIIFRMAAGDQGVRVPGDCSLAAFDWEDDAVRSYAISAMDLPVKRYADEAVRMLLAKIERPDDRIKSVAQRYVWCDAGSVIAR